MRSKAVNLQFNNFQLVTPEASATVKIQNKPIQFPMKRLFCKCLLVVVFLFGFTAAALADALDNWYPGTNLLARNAFLGVTYGNGQFVAVGQSTLPEDTGIAEISSDGTNWTWTTYVPTNFLSDLYDVTFANGKFVACGSDGSLWTSINGVDWAMYYVQTSANLPRVIYGDGLFVAVGDGAVQAEKL
jgi:hypothetical protein